MPAPTRPSLRSDMARLLNFCISSFLTAPKPHTESKPLLSSTPSVFYLAYGSNLDSGTFEGRRGIRPLSETVVTVPTLKLVFDLPGIAYLEPCFANVQPISQPTPSSTSLDTPLVGVVYQVSAQDYATIIATEGAGAAYQDVVVDCFPLSDNGGAPLPPLKAHTLLAPPHRTRCGNAQASARYLGLITSGAAQRGLPQEYREKLARYKPYRITSLRQRVGAVLFAGIWVPVAMVALMVAKLVPKDEGRAPGWVSCMNRAIFGSMWWSYDHAFKRVFGDGERTEGEDDELEEEEVVVEEEEVLVAVAVAEKDTLHMPEETPHRAEETPHGVEEMLISLAGGEAAVESSIASLSSWERI